MEARGQRAPLRQPVPVRLLGTGQDEGCRLHLGQQYGSIHVFHISCSRYRWKLDIPRVRWKYTRYIVLLGVSGVTEPRTQLRGLLSPSQSSFPKGNNTWPKAPPAAATSLNLQLPGADSKSQKRTDFSRERWRKWKQKSSEHERASKAWISLCRKANEVGWGGGGERRGRGRKMQPQSFLRTEKDLKQALYASVLNTVNGRLKNFWALPLTSLCAFWFPARSRPLLISFCSG